MLHVLVHSSPHINLYEQRTQNWRAVFSNKIALNVRTLTTYHFLLIVDIFDKQKTKFYVKIYGYFSPSDILVTCSL